MPTAAAISDRDPLPRPAVRAVVSLLILFHVTAVFVGPWAMPIGNFAFVSPQFVRAWWPGQGRGAQFAMSKGGTAKAPRSAPRSAGSPR